MGIYIHIYIFFSSVAFIEVVNQLWNFSEDKNLVEKG